jgi:hypothetical protein
METHLLALALVTAVLIIAAIAVFVANRRERAFLESPELVAGLLGRVGTWASRLNIPWPASHTALEHAAQFGRMVPEADPVVGRIAALFVAQRYGRQRFPSERVATLVNRLLS